MSTQKKRSQRKLDKDRHVFTTCLGSNAVRSNNGGGASQASQLQNIRQTLAHLQNATSFTPTPTPTPTPVLSGTLSPVTGGTMPLRAQAVNVQDMPVRAAVSVPVLLPVPARPLTGRGDSMIGARSDEDARHKAVTNAKAGAAQSSIARTTSTATVITTRDATPSGNKAKAKASTAIAKQSVDRGTAKPRVEQAAPEAKAKAKTTTEIEVAAVAKNTHPTTMDTLRWQQHTHVCMAAVRAGRYANAENIPLDDDSDNNGVASAAAGVDTIGNASSGGDDDGGNGNGSDNGNFSERYALQVTWQGQIEIEASVSASANAHTANKNRAAASEWITDLGSQSWRQQQLQAHNLTAVPVPCSGVLGIHCTVVFDDGDGDRIEPVNRRQPHHHRTWLSESFYAELCTSRNAILHEFPMQCTRSTTFACGGAADSCGFFQATLAFQRDPTTPFGLVPSLKLCSINDSKTVASQPPPLRYMVTALAFAVM